LTCRAVPLAARLAAVVLLLCTAGLALPADAQASAVTLTVRPTDLGIEGYARTGDWNAARLTLESAELASRSVICRWSLRDIDGDRVIAQRRLVLNPGLQQRVWLYAPLPMNWRSQTPWSFEVVDAESGARLAAQDAIPPSTLDPATSAIGLFTNAPIGLDAYLRRDSNQRRLDLLHETVIPIRSLVSDRMPDQWFGMDLFNVMIWTSDGDSYDDDAVSPDQQRALTEWVRRGGHLVISLPAVGDAWLGLPDNHPLRPLIPVTSGQARRVEGPAPMGLLGASLARGGQPVVTRTVFNIPIDGLPGVAVIAEDDQKQPVAIAHRVGFGRVTLLGIDLADRRLTLANLPLPHGNPTLWRTLLGWRGPAIAPVTLDAEIDASNIGRPHLRDQAFLDEWVAGQTDRPGTVATALLLAILVFGLYWLLAGPVAFGVLRARQLTHRSWVVFAGIVAVFTVISWVGALFLRPSTENITHVSVVDFAHGDADVRVQSWFSLFLPAFGAQAIDLAPDTPDDPHTLASPGLSRQNDAATYPDPQTYTLDARTPHTYPPTDLPDAGGIPFRSTSKTFSAHYLGPLDEGTAGLTDAWVPPQGRLRIENAFPVGELSHALPGTLTDTVAVYCPGDNQTPWVWRLGNWAPGTMLALAPPTNADRLVRRATTGMAKRAWKAEGFLGVSFDNVNRTAIANLTQAAAPAADTITTRLHLLSFFNHLPAVDYQNTDTFPAPVELRRFLTRDADLSHLTAGKRLILLGNLRDAPSPLPLHAQGDTVPSEGWTLVRWIYDFD
jgi:hypothetical protein